MEPRSSKLEWTNFFLVVLTRGVKLTAEGWLMWKLE